MKTKFWNETQKTSECHVFIDWSRYCNLSTRSATYHLLRCALDYRQWSSDFEPSKWYLQLSRRGCHLHRVWWNGRRWQILFLVLCSLSCCDYHCSFIVAEIFRCSEEKISSSLFWIFICVKQRVFDTSKLLKQIRHRKPKSSSAGFGSSPSGLEVQRAIDCATRTFGMSECYLKRLSGIRMNALCTCFSFSSSFIKTDRIKTAYHFLSVRSLTRRLCRAVVNPVFCWPSNYKFPFWICYL